MRVVFPFSFLVPAMVWISGLIAFSQETPPPPPEAPATGASEPGVEALKRVRNLGFRLKDHEPAAAVAKSAQPAAAPADSAAKEPAGSAGEAPLQLGRVKGNVSLPPEVAAIAKEEMERREIGGVSRSVSRSGSAGFREMGANKLGANWSKAG
jgi:hypothetical protein